MGGVGLLVKILVVAIGGRAATKLSADRVSTFVCNLFGPYTSRN